MRPRRSGKESSPKMNFNLVNRGTFECEISNQFIDTKAYLFRRGFNRFIVPRHILSKDLAEDICVVNMTTTFVSHRRYGFILG